MGVLFCFFLFLVVFFFVRSLCNRDYKKKMHMQGLLLSQKHNYALSLNHAQLCARLIFPGRPSLELTNTEYAFQ